MFTDRKDCIKLAEGIYVFKKAIDQKNIDIINNIMSNLVENDNTKEAMDHNVNWYRGKTTPAIPELLPIWEKCSELIFPEYVIHPNLALQVIRKGQDMFVHTDSPGRDNDEMLKSVDMWSTCCVIDYGMVAYFGKWEGGEIFYPNISDENGNKPLIYNPEPGDVVIHKSVYPFEHGVKEVTDGIRYAFSNFMVKSEENPGTFYNYKTDAYNKSISDLNLWIRPLWENPIFPGGKMVDENTLSEAAELARQKRKEHSH